MKSQTEAAEVVTGTLLEAHEGMVVLGLDGTDYQLHLEVAAAPDVPLKKPVTGKILAKARRVDVVGRGGRFIEPVYGRPRRLQGTVIATDDQSHTITVRCGGGCPFTCRIMESQKPADFGIGVLVGFDVERGARIELDG